MKLCYCDGMGRFFCISLFFLFSQAAIACPYHGDGDGDGDELDSYSFLPTQKLPSFMEVKNLPPENSKKLSSKTKKKKAAKKKKES